MNIVRKCLTLPRDSVALSGKIRDLLKSTVTGIREGQNVDYGKLREYYLPIPPIEEQKAMAEYLDATTAEIDKAIAQQQRMIDLLNERKQIIIQNAVTKGLNSNVPMKDSGVKWIGDMPSHWEVYKGKMISQIQCGCPFDSKLFTVDAGFPLIRIRDITSGQIETYYSGSYDKRYVVTRNDLLVGMDGDFNVRWWDNEDALLNQRCCRVFASELVSLRFLYYYLPIGLKVINDLTPATTIKHLSDKDIKNMPVCVPPITEQKLITELLDGQCILIDKAILQHSKIVEALKERKRIIINDVVTGKIKVS